MRHSWPRGLLAFTTARRETLKTGLLDARLTASGPSPPGGRRGLPTFPAIRCRLVAPVRRARSSIGAACGGGAAAATGLACEEGPRPRPAVLGSPSAGARVLLSPLPQLRLHPVPSGLGAAETCRSHGGRGGPHCQEDGQDGAEEERGERGGWRGPGGSQGGGRGPRELDAVGPSRVRGGSRPSHASPPCAGSRQGQRPRLGEGVLEEVVWSGGRKRWDRFLVLGSSFLVPPDKPNQGVCPSVVSFRVSKPSLI